MDQDRNTQLMTPGDTKLRAQNVSNREALDKLTAHFSRIVQAKEADHGSTRIMLNQDVGPAAKRVLSALSTWLARVALFAAPVTHVFWSLIISILPKRNTTLPPSSPEDTRGPVRSFDVKLENVVYSVRTAIDSTQSSNRDITHTMISKDLCSRSSAISMSNNEFELLRSGIEAGTVDLAEISAEELLHMSFLSIFGGDILHVDRNIVHKGNMYDVHFCVQGVAPNQQVEAINKKA